MFSVKYDYFSPIGNGTHFFTVGSPKPGETTMLSSRCNLQTKSHIISFTYITNPPPFVLCDNLYNNFENFWNELSLKKSLVSRNVTYDVFTMAEQHSAELKQTTFSSFEAILAKRVLWDYEKNRLMIELTLTLPQFRQERCKIAVAYGVISVFWQLVYRLILSSNVVGSMLTSKKEKEFLQAVYQTICEGENEFFKSLPSGTDYRIFNFLKLGLNIPECSIKKINKLESSLSSYALSICNYSYSDSLNVKAYKVILELGTLFSAKNAISCFEIKLSSPYCDLDILSQLSASFKVKKGADCFTIFFKIEVNNNVCKFSLPKIYPHLLRALVLSMFAPLTYWGVKEKDEDIQRCLREIFKNEYPGLINGEFFKQKFLNFEQALFGDSQVLVI